jgi:hypothetical protein
MDDAGEHGVAAMSPLVGGGLTMTAEVPAETALWSDEMARLASPFAEGLAAAGASAEATDPVDELVRELTDDEFDEAVGALVDEIAARHLSSRPSWSSESDGPMLGSGEAEEWVAGLAAKADRYLEHLEAQFADRSADELTDDEIDAAIAQLSADDTVTPVEGELFGGFAKKVFSGAKALAKTGLKLASGLLPVGKIFAIARKLVPSLLRRVLNKAINRLPRGLQDPARKLAKGLQATAVPGSAAEVAEEFDQSFAEALLAPTEAAADQVLAEADDETMRPTSEPVAALDEARAQLASQLVEATPGEPPVAPIEQFIPAVMAAMPLVRKGIQLLGLRDKIKGILAKGLAALIKDHVGADAARALSPRIAEIGLKMLQLETIDPAGLGAEGLVSALEETIREVVELPDESLDDPLRVQAEVEHAFAKAAARYLPREVLRADVAPFETDDEGAVWVAMPRSTRPRYRYRKCPRVYRERIGRPQARAIVLAGEDTLEERLLDAGVGTWPVEAEVHLYEAMPGTHLGHLAAFEVDEPREAGEPLRTDEFEELTAEAAAALLGRPGLGRQVGRRAGHHGRGRVLHPGQRLFRLVVPGVPVRRRQRRLVLRLDTTRPAPVLRLHLRISEREGHNIAAALSSNAHPAVAAQLRTIVGTRLRQRLAERLDAHSRRALGAPLPEGRGAALANQLAESMLTTVTKQLPSAAATLGSAARDRAAGLTLTFAYNFVSKAAITTAAPSAPTLTIRPGYRHD